MQSRRGTIVVAYGGTEHCSEALDWAAAQAQQSDRPLTVLHVVDRLGVLPGPVGALPWLGPTTKTAERLVAEGAARARRSAASIDITPVVLSGRVADTLIRASREADLLVLGTRGHADLAGALFGSVSFTVSGHAGCPVVVVRGDSTEPPGPHRPVVVGVDDSSDAASALRYAADTAAGANAPLTVVTTYLPLPSADVPEAACFGSGPVGTDGPDVDPMARAAAVRVASAAATTATRLHPELDVREHVVTGSTVGQLSTAAHRAGLLVVGSRGRAGLAGLLPGSVSHGLIHSAPCPVAVLHGPSYLGRSADPEAGAACPVPAAPETVRGTR